ncbi:hypothetical protein [Nocardia neocaledoniensis]|uniref:hypothetical protein n=1 Tax=Nocardia neocaledoniensis TaxID=236511 RepID=UPI0024569F59|nr:hypothetical protein [Nocardia neocaledoniensis]
MRDRAVAGGESASRPDTALVRALLLGPLYAWLIVLGEDPARVPEPIRVAATTAANVLTASLLPT